ncbi:MULTISPECIES: UPF0175 family protein [unclassified Roseofilum]|uniref:UPF0175 family protein n=1 Tax=unclassified Roseofilum TaxID=2620099 RepID=UPI000E847FE1|nr:MULTISPECIES: UPF0175 family protein [unclassified Roseofilum]MBP0008459.1 UPF0175 family protein [Roseofilum sp. Belize Diploria]MBP0026782.1 UPF0175 family protein [Roseofilum sp. Guam]MBP0033236.1 UPF0175 family protein [Roseofilum sp. Belize BBD 4]HBR00805.1 hypothetical protein [Cyanobacteria bacterium UBA11691]
MIFTFLDEQLANIELSEQVRQRAMEKAKEGYVMALLEVGEISSGRAAKILGISRLEMIDRMHKWGISVFDDSQDLQEFRQEVEQAELRLNQSI